MNHTPGPWFIVDAKSRLECAGNVIETPAWEIASGPAGTTRYIIAEVYKKEDAQMIVATLDMLDILKGLLESCNHGAAIIRPENEERMRALVAQVKGNARE